MRLEANPGANPASTGMDFRNCLPAQAWPSSYPRVGGVGPIRMTYRETMAVFCRGLGADINISNGTPIGEPQPRVVDKTGLAGTYEFTLEFAGSMRLSGTMPSEPAGGEPGVPLASDPADGAPDIFTAVEQQLGLKLVKAGGIPVDVLIGDSADQVPTEN